MLLYSKMLIKHKSFEYHFKKLEISYKIVHILFIHCSLFTAHVRIELIFVVVADHFSYCSLSSMKHFQSQPLHRFSYSGVVCRCYLLNILYIETEHRSSVIHRYSIFVLPLFYQSNRLKMRAVMM